MKFKFAMTKTKLNDFLIEASYLSIVFLIPIYFNFFFPSSDPFESSKMILFRSLVWILLFLSVRKFVAIKNFKNLFINSTKKYLYLPLLILLYSLLTLLWSVDPVWSFYGSSLRQISLYNELFFVLWLVLMFWNLSLFQRNKNYLRRLLVTISLSSLVVSFYAVLQYFGIDFLSWQEPAFLTGRSMSTLGQPNFLASFLLLSVPISFYLIYTNKNIYLRCFFIVSSLLQVLAIIFSGSRGAWLGFLLALCIVALFYKKSRKVSLIVFSALLCLFVVLSLGTNVFSKRFQDGFNLKQGSSAVRMFLYSSSLSAIIESPQGFGPENQREALMPYYKASLVQDNKINIIFDRAHNLFLDTALNLGIIGLAFCLYFYFFIFKIIKRNVVAENKVLFLALFLSLLAYLLSLLFNFSTVVTCIYFYLLVAIIFSLDYAQGNDFLIEDDVVEKDSFKKPAIFKILILSFVALTSLGGVYRELKNLQADYYFSQVQTTFFQGEVPTSMELFSYFKENDPLFRDYYENFISMVFDNISESRDYSAKFLATEKIKTISPLFSNSKNKGYFYNLNKAQILALSGNFIESQEIFTELSARSPFYSYIYFKQAQLNILQKDKEGALLNYEKALNLLPEESLVNGDINLNSLLDYKNLINIKIESLK